MKTQRGLVSRPAPAVEVTEAATEAGQAAAAAAVAPSAEEISVLTGRGEGMEIPSW